MTVTRQMRRALARKAAKIYVQKNRAHLSRDERRELTRGLAAKAVRELPASEFEKHMIDRPRIIVPEVEIQAEGLNLRGIERKSPGGIILP